mmetsp:Transcript_45013/g.150293  ORF Transcript_45013/g.150293 Transcript_45013/m.150293 type:complete len:254 (+) Transcript_45013:75-836(+)
MEVKDGADRNHWSLAACSVSFAPRSALRATAPVDLPSLCADDGTQDRQVEAGGRAMRALEPGLCYLAVLVERGRILQGAHVLGLDAAHQIAHRELHLFARARVRDLLHLPDESRHVRVRGARADGGADLGLELRIEPAPVGELDEEDDAHIAGALARLNLVANHERILDGADRLGEAVHLSGTDAHPTRLERGVGAAVDHEAAALSRRTSHLDEVAVVPHTVILGEIGAAVAALALVVAKEADRRGDERRAAD